MRLKAAIFSLKVLRKLHATSRYFAGYGVVDRAYPKKCLDVRPRRGHNVGTQETINSVLLIG